MKNNLKLDNWMRCMTQHCFIKSGSDVHEHLFIQVLSRVYLILLRYSTYKYYRFTYLHLDFLNVEILRFERTVLSSILKYSLITDQIVKEMYNMYVRRLTCDPRSVASFT